MLGLRRGRSSNWCAGRARPGHDVTFTEKEFRLHLSVKPVVGGRTKPNQDK